MMPRETGENTPWELRQKALNSSNQLKSSNVEVEMGLLVLSLDGWTLSFETIGKFPRVGPKHLVIEGCPYITPPRLDNCCLSCNIKIADNSCFNNYHWTNQTQLNTKCQGLG